MPLLALEIPETYDSITRPVVVGLVQDLLDRLGLSLDLPIAYTGVINALPQKGTQLTSDADPVQVPFFEQIKVQVDEHYLDIGVLTTPVKQEDSNYLFCRTELGVHIRPVYTRAEIVVNFTYRVPSRTQAFKWRDGLRRRMSEGVQAQLHELTYHYSIPPVYLEILREIWRKRESVAGYDQTFTEFLRDGFTPLLTALTNLSGEAALLAIPERQIQVMGWFSFNTEPTEVEQTDEGSAWEVTFEYTIQYDKLTTMVMRYPVSVHNQLLDLKYVDTALPYNPYNQPRRLGITGRNNDRFSMINYNLDTFYQGVRLPVYDDWSPPRIDRPLLPVITALIGVDLCDPTLVVNLLDMGDVTFTQTVANYLFRTRRETLVYQASPFHILLYKGQTQLDPEMFYIDEDMCLRCTVPLDPRAVYHMRFTLMTNLLTLTRPAQDLLRHDPAVCIQLFDVLDGLQYKKVPFVEGLFPHSSHGNFLRGLMWYPAHALRPGFASPNRDWSLQRPIDGGIEWPYHLPNMHCTFLGTAYEISALREPLPAYYANGLYPVITDVFPDAEWTEITESYPLDTDTWPFKTAAELILSEDVQVVATFPMEEGRQPLLCIYKTHYIRVFVNHFLQVRLEDAWALTLVDYVAQYQTETARAVFDNRALGLVVLPCGIFKPTVHSSKPIRLTSPTRPGQVGPMASDDLHILGGRVITDRSFFVAVGNLSTQLDLMHLGHGMGMKTVMQAGIIAHHSSRYYSGG